MQGKGSNSTLIANVEDNLIIGGHTVVQPQNLRCHQGSITDIVHQQLPLGMLLQIMSIQIFTTRVGKFKCLGVGAVDIREIG